MKMWKVYRQTDGRTDGRTEGQTDRQTTDDRWSEKLTWAFSSGELKITWKPKLTYWLEKLKLIHIYISIENLKFPYISTQRKKIEHLSIFGACNTQKWICSNSLMISQGFLMTLSTLNQSQYGSYAFICTLQKSYFELINKLICFKELFKDKHPLVLIDYIQYPQRYFLQDKR